jgi:hypothetical protein
VHHVCAAFSRCSKTPPTPASGSRLPLARLAHCAGAHNVSLSAPLFATLPPTPSSRPDSRPRAPAATPASRGSDPSACNNASSAANVAAHVAERSSRTPAPVQQAASSLPRAPAGRPHTPAAGRDASCGLQRVGAMLAALPRWARCCGSAARWHSVEMVSWHLPVTLLASWPGAVLRANVQC